MCNLLKPVNKQREAKQNTRTKEHNQVDPKASSPTPPGTGARLLVGDLGLPGHEEGEAAGAGVWENRLGHPLGMQGGTFSAVHETGGSDKQLLESATGLKTAWRKFHQPSLD